MAVQMLGIKTKFTDDQGRPLVGGSVHTYYAGTSLPQDTFSDPELTVPNTNPVNLDDAGSANIFLKGTYRVRVFDKDGVFVEEQDNVDQLATVAEVFKNKGGLNAANERIDALTSEVNSVKEKTIIVESIADLSTINNPKDGLRVYVKSYHAGLRKGGGIFMYVSSNDIRNDNCVFFKHVNESGQFIRYHEGVITPEMGGAIGGHPEKDTQGLFNCLQYINERGGNCTLKLEDIYHLGTCYTNTIEEVEDTEAWQTKLKNYPQCQMHFANVNNLRIEGPGGIYVPDEGTPDYPHGITTYSIFAFNNCNHIMVDGLSIDGNRLGQTHTIGLRTGHNHGFAVRPDSNHITVQNCYISNLGSLRISSDKRGDAIYVSNGAKNIFFRFNTIKNIGRWACVLESGPGGTDNYVIEGNTYYGANRDVAPEDPNDYCQQALGFVDIESFTNHSNIIIRDNIIYRSGVISFAGYNSNYPEVYVNTFVVDNNTWHCEEIGGNDGYHRILTMGGSTTSTKRTLENLSFCGNTINLGSAELGITSTNRVLALERLTIKDAQILNNKVNIYSGETTGSGDTSGMHFRNCRLLGIINVSGNTVNNSGYSQVWFGVNGAAHELGPHNFIMTFRDNFVSKAHRGFVWNGFDEYDKAELYAVNNIINCNHNELSDLVNGFSDSIYVYTDNPVSSKDYIDPSLTPSYTEVYKAEKRVNDTLLDIFKVTNASIGAVVSIDTVVLINDNSKNTGQIKFEAKYEAVEETVNKWVINTNISYCSGSADIIVEPDGSDLLIKARKGSGGSLALVELKGRILTYKCGFESIKPEVTE